MIDAALQDRFPSKPIEIGEAYDYGDRTDFVDRELPSRDREEYRAQDPSTREVQTAYADLLGDVLGDSVDLARVRKLAQDLSGKYGLYSGHLRTVDDDGMITIDRMRLHGAELIAETHPDVARDSDGNPIAFLLNGPIMKDDLVVGELHRTFYRDTAGNLVVYEDLLTLKKEFRRKGFSKALISELLPYYQRSDVDRVALLAWSEDGGLVWALRGLSWDLHPGRLRESLESVRRSARELLKRVTPEARAVLEEYLERLKPDHPRFPEPIELANLRAPGVADLGHQLMRGTGWHAVMYLRDEPAGGE
jgi:GNAT superfamily N-acetyltransferase